MTGWDDDPTNPWSGAEPSDDTEPGFDEGEPDESDVLGLDEAIADEVPDVVAAPPAPAAADPEPDADGSSGTGQLDPVAAVPVVEAVTFGPLTERPTAQERDLLPGVTDVAADIGYALGVGADELGLVDVEVNGLMGVKVTLAPGLVTLGSEQAGHHLASALRDAHVEVVGYLEEHFRSHPTTAEWLEMRPESDESGLAGGQAAARPDGRTCTSRDGLVTVLVSPSGGVASVMVNSDDVDLARIAPAFVAAAEHALQGGDDAEPGLDVAGRLAQFDQALAKLDKSMDDLDAELDRALGS